MYNQCRKEINSTHVLSFLLLKVPVQIPAENIYNKQMEDEESGRVLLDIIVDRKGFNLEKN